MSLLNFGRIVAEKFNSTLIYKNTLSYKETLENPFLCVEARTNELWELWGTFSGTTEYPEYILLSDFPYNRAYGAVQILQKTQFFDMDIFTNLFDIWTWFVLLHYKHCSKL